MADYGTIQIVIHLDGSSLPRESAAAGAQAGRIASKAFNAAYTKSLIKNGKLIKAVFAKQGLLSGIAFSAGFKKAFKRIGTDLATSLSTAFGRIRASASSLAGNIGFALQKEFRTVGDIVRLLGGQVQESFAQMTRSIGRTADVARGRLGSALREIGEDFRTGPLNDVVYGLRRMQGAMLNVARIGILGLEAGSQSLQRNLTKLGRTFREIGEDFRIGPLNEFMLGLRHLQVAALDVARIGLIGLEAGMQKMAPAFAKLNAVATRTRTVFKELSTSIRGKIFGQLIAGALTYGHELSAINTQMQRFRAGVEIAVARAGIRFDMLSNRVKNFGRDLIETAGPINYLAAAMSVGFRKAQDTAASFARTVGTDMREGFAALKLSASIVADNLGTKFGNSLTRARLGLIEMRGVAYTVGAAFTKYIGGPARRAGAAVGNAFRGLPALFNKFIIAPIGRAGSAIGRAGSYMASRLKEVAAPLVEVASRIKQVASAQLQMSKSTDTATKSLNKQGSTWSKIPHNGRQIILIVTAIATAMTQLAPLGSAAGSGLLVLGGAAAAGAVGIGVMVAAFKGLGDDIATLPAAVQPAAAAFQSFKSSLDGLQDVIQGAAAGGLAVGFASLESTVTALKPAFEAFGAVVGQVFANFAASLAPGTQGFALLQGFIEGSAPIFASLAGAVMGLGTALGLIFQAAQPFILNFTDALGGLIQDFVTWAADPALGGTALTTFFQHGADIISSILPFLAAVGDALSSLVTEDTIASTVGFFDALTDFVPLLGLILGAITQLDVFGILAELLKAVGIALEPILPLLGGLGEIINGLLVQALQFLGPLIGSLLTALAPLIPIIGDLAVALLPPLMAIIGALGEAFVKLIGPIIDIVTVLLDALMPIILPLADLLVSLIGPVLEPLVIAFTAVGAVIEWLGPLLKLIGQIVGAVIATIVALIKGDFSSIGKIWADVWTGMSSLFEDVWTNIVDFAEWSINKLIDLINGLTGGIRDVAGAAGIKIPKIPHVKFAAGGLVMHHTFAEIGEAGPEMVVPLRRPLSQVDPAVRPFSALAQGRGAPSLGGPQRVVNVQPGAIVVQAARSPYNTASAVLDRMVQKI